VVEKVVGVGELDVLMSEGRTESHNYTLRYQISMQLVS
jgi:hypothetical protein